MAGIAQPTPDGSGDLDQPNLFPYTTTADPDASPETVGQNLSKARQRNGKMLMDVWRDLKIPPQHLIAIENSSFEALPGRAYAIGFVRSYAAYLGLDAEKLVARLRVEMAGPDARLTAGGPAPPLESRVQPDAALAVSGSDFEAEFPPIESGASRLSPPGPQQDSRVLQRIIAGVIVSVLIYSGYYVVWSAGRVAPPPVMPVPAKLAQEAGLPRETIRPAIATFAPPAVAIAPPPPAISHEPALPPPIEAVPVQPVSVAAEPESKIQAPPPPVLKSRVILRVRRPIRVAVLATSNRILIDRVLRAGETYRVPNLAGVKLTVRDAGAVELILDGNPVGSAGENGVAARGLSLDPPSIISRYRWQKG